MSKEYPSYNVYKGLQKPLIFKGFKGKFIYIGGACIISALLLCAIVSTLASFYVGRYNSCNSYVWRVRNNIAITKKRASQER